jgi:hypothetical protein
MDFWVRGLRIGPSACNNGWDITNDYFYFRLLRFVKKKEINRRIEERDPGMRTSPKATMPGHPRLWAPAGRTGWDWRPVGTMPWGLRRGGSRALGKLLKNLLYRRQ